MARMGTDGGFIRVTHPQNLVFQTRFFVTEGTEFEGGHRGRCIPLGYIVLKSSQAERIFQQLEQKFTGGNRENGVGFDPEAQFGHGFFRGSRRWSRILKYHPDIFDHGWARIYTDGLGAQSVSIREIRGFNCRFRDSSASSAASCKIQCRFVWLRLRRARPSASNGIF